jgi:hypothetical protein
MFHIIFFLRRSLWMAIKTFVFRGGIPLVTAYANINNTLIVFSLMQYAS